jgi:dCMP deaminase
MRPSLNKIFMQTAELFAQRSTCIRVQVGSILVKNNKIIATGYNGSTKNHIHCTDYFKDIVDINSKEFKSRHLQFSEEYELHSEINVLLFCAKEGISTNGTTIYITLSPCLSCAKAILVSGIIKVIYKDDYDRDLRGISFLQENGIIVEKF